MKDGYKYLAAQQLSMGEEMMKIQKNFDINFYTLLKAKGAILAGGAILSLFTNAKIVDWDIWFRTEEDFKEVLEYTDKMREKFTKQYAPNRVDNLNALTFSYITRRETCTIQFIKKVFGDPYEVINNFDMTVCMGAFDFKTEQFVFHPEFFKHISQKKIVLNKNLPYALKALLRVFKYQSKGYTIGEFELLKLGIGISKLNIQTCGDLAEHIKGIYLTSPNNFVEHLQQNKDKEVEPDTLEGIFANFKLNASQGTKFALELEELPF